LPVTPCFMQASAKAHVCNATHIRQPGSKMRLPAMTIDQVVHSVSTVEAVGKTLELLTAQQGPKNWHYMLICDVGMIAMHAFATHMCLLAHLLAEIKSNLNKSETGHRCEAAANDTDVAHSIGGQPGHYTASACPPPPDHKINLTVTLQARGYNKAAPPCSRLLLTNCHLLPQSKEVKASLCSGPSRLGKHIRIT